MSFLDACCAGAVVRDGVSRLNVCIIHDLAPIIDDRDAPLSERLSAATEYETVYGRTYASMEVHPPEPMPTTEHESARICSGVGVANFAAMALPFRTASLRAVYECACRIPCCRDLGNGCKSRPKI